jgi:hypothetical protein
MYSDLKRGCILLLVLLVISCSSYRKLERIRSGEVRMGLGVSEDKPLEDETPEVDIDSIRGSLAEGPILMNAIRDSETGEMVATDIISASRVVARFRNVAERGGLVSISFDVIVPEEMKDSKYQLKIWPYMTVAGDTLGLDPLYITGEKYRSKQIRGYERYRAFLASIISDTTDFIRVGQLEVFLARNFPQTYAMKNDSSLVDDIKAESLFGVTQTQAVEHYTRMWQVRANERRKGMKEKMFAKYVRDPLAVEGIRLDTVLTASSGDFIYRYVHTFRPPPRVKKVEVLLRGRLYENGLEVARLPFPENIAFYISSLNGLVEDKIKYKIVVLERKAYDNTKALLDFRQGSAEMDTLMGDNASELRRVRKCMEQVISNEEFELDSLKITASCSLEGSFELNKRLSGARAETVRKVLEDDFPQQWQEKVQTAALPENWEQFSLLVANDTMLTESVKKRIESQVKIASKRPDAAEAALAKLSEYRYLREKIYPKLRSVKFEFYMHRVGMLKDTVHTSEVDSVYMHGLEALKDMDYNGAVTLLKPYRDYNCALALASADYNHTALDVLQELPVDNPKVCYLMAIVLSRLDQKKEASKYLDLSIAYDPMFKYRANLDPELSGYINNL